LRPVNLAVTAIILLSALTVVGAITGPQTRATGFRTDPVLRALGVPPEERAGSLAEADAVPSLSATPRFVLPLVRRTGRRALVLPEPGGAPVPPPPPVVAALPAAPVPRPAIPPAPVPAAAVVAALPPAAASRAAAAERPEPPKLIATVMVPPPPPPLRERQPGPRGEPMLAVIIDDVGPAVQLSRRAVQLPRPVTMAFLPYADNLPALTAMAAAHGHEIFLHLPMEPVGDEDPGPNAILVGLDPHEAERRIVWAFDRVPEATGVNNHMGSRATADPESMLRVLQEVRRRGLEFVDSRTSALSVGDGLAGRLGLPHAARDVFLDNDPSSSAILRRLAEAEHLARRRGQALAIGHPYPTTLAVLEQWLPAAEARGLRIGRASDLIARTWCEENGGDLPEAIPISSSAADGDAMRLRAAGVPCPAPARLGPAASR
jgi:polysaccharide deacetylase 2 family uncharacterized protein YibQ